MNVNIEATYQGWVVDWVDTQGDHWWQRFRTEVKALRFAFQLMKYGTAEWCNHGDLLKVVRHEI